MFTTSILKRSLSAAGTTSVLALAACSGGGGNNPVIPSQTTTPVSVATATPVSATATPTAVSSAAAASTQQVVSISIPTSSIGRENDPTFGTISGYTQSIYSQTLAFAPGSQIMLHNGQTNVPHTLGDLGTASFPASQPSSLSTTGTGGSTIGSGFQSGTIAPGATVGPFTLTAGTYYIGCAYHYQSDGMRDVLQVAAAATPGPQATQAPNAPTPSPTSTAGAGGGYGY